MSRRAWTRQEELTALTMREAGYSVEAVAVRLGRSRAAVRQRCWQARKREYHQLELPVQSEATGGDSPA